MKKLILSAALVVSLASTTAMAGSLADPVVEADLIVADSGSSSSGTVVSLLLIALIAAVVD
jgi:hypothetical protein